MNLKDYLDKALYIQMMIRTKREQIEILKEQSEILSSEFSEKVKTSKNKNTQSDLIIKIIELKEDYEKELDNLLTIKKNISKLISNIQDLKIKTILEQRYINTKSFPEIALFTNYSIKHVHRLHAEGLSKLEVYYNEL